MKAENVYNQFLITAKYLLKELDYYGVNQFKSSIPNQKWTIGEVYDYLLNGTMNFYIPKINKCLNPSTGNLEGKKKFKGKFIFWYKRIPAVFNYTDICDYQPVQPANPEKVKDNFYKFIKVMNKTALEIDKSGVQSKVEHPTLGMLSALEWYKLIEMNFKYHLKLKYELDKVVRSAYQESSQEEYPEYVVPLKEGEDEEII